MENPIFRSADPIGEADLDAFEAETGLALPPDYRAWLLAHNGGVPRRNRFLHRHRPGQPGRETWVRWLFPLGRGGVIGESAGDLRSAHRDRPAGLPAGLLPVAEAYFLGNLGRVCLECAGSRVGRVVFRPDVEPVRNLVYPVADSWTAFLEGMDYEHGRPLTWKIAIEDGDVDALREELGRHDGWRHDLGQATEIVRAAAAFDAWPAAEVLLDLGFDPADIFDEALTSDRFDLARRVLGTGKVPARAVECALARGTDAMYRRLGVMAELLAAGADVDAASVQRDRPLHRAVAARSEAAVRWLLENGADPTRKDDSRRTPRAVAEGIGEPALAAILEAAEASWDEASSRAPLPDVAPFDLAGVRLDDPGPALSPDDIRAFERMIDLELPPEYRWLLLQANGGRPAPNRLPTEAGEDEDEEGEDEEDEDEEGEDRSEPEVAVLFRLREADRGAAMRYRADVFTVEQMALDWRSDRFEVPPGMVVIGSLESYGYEGYGFLLLGCEGEDAGRLFAAEFDVEPLGLTLPQLFAAMGAGAKGPRSPDEALIEAIERRDLDGVRAAIAAGARATRVKPDGTGPLPLACESGFDEAVIAMAEAGVKVGKLREVAAMTGRTALVRRLLDLGPRPSKKALNELLASCPALFHDVELVREMVARGADLKADWQGKPMILLAAARSGSVEGLKLVLDAGHSPHYWDRHTGSLLHVAAPASPGAAGIIRHLLGLGVRPNRPDAQGYTALHRAVFGGNIEAARALIDAGEDLHARHPLPTSGAERAAAAQMMGMIEGLRDRGDAPPPPDATTPLGGGLAQVQAAFYRKLQDVEGTARERIEAIASGHRLGISAAEMAHNNPRVQAVLAELEEYASRKRS